MISFSELFACQNTAIYSKTNDQRKHIATQKLVVLVDPDNDLLLIMGPICYGITNQTSAEFCLYKNDDRSFMTLELKNHLQGNYELEVNQNCQLLIACLAQRCQVIGKQKPVSKGYLEALKTPTQNIKQEIFIEGPKDEKQDLEIGLPLQQNDGKVVQASKYLGQGIYWVGKLVSKGIQKVGGLIATNVEPGTQIKLGQATKKGIKTASQVTTTVYELASGTVRKLISEGRQLALDAADQKQPRKSVEEEKVLNIKGGVATGVKVFINLYDGFVEAGDEVRRGTFKAGGEIVKKKFGVQAEQTLKHVAGGVENVVGIYKLPKDSVKYLFRVDKQSGK